MTGEIGHPAWCAREHCYLSDGTRAHQGESACSEDALGKLRVQSCLLDPEGDPNLYVELKLENLRLTWVRYYGILPVEVARRLRDQLTEDLDAVDRSRHLVTR